jgi:hypothetical protein
MRRAAAGHGALAAPVREGGEDEQLKFDVSRNVRLASETASPAYTDPSTVETSPLILHRSEFGVARSSSIRNPWK